MSRHESTISKTDTSKTEDSGGTGALPPAFPALAVVLEAARPDAGCFACSLQGIERVVIGRGSERRALRHGAELRLELPDRRASKRHAALERGDDGFVLSDL